MFTIDIDMSKVDAAMKRLDQATGRAALQRGAMKAGLFLEGQAKMRAPVDTGFLRNSIQTTPEGDGAKVTVGAEYGIHQEYGTRYQPGTPFIRPTVDQDGAQAAQIVLDEVMREAGL